MSPLNEWSDVKLIKYVKAFREGILAGRASSRMCGVVCYPLVGLLNFEGLSCQLAESDTKRTNHIWIRLYDGRVLDPTADQFGKNYPSVYLGPPLDIHKRERTYGRS